MVPDGPDKISEEQAENALSGLVEGISSFGSTRRLLIILSLSFFMFAFFLIFQYLGWQAMDVRLSQGEMLTLAMAVLVFLSFVVVPTFSSIFDDFMLELSDLTMMVVWFSDQVLSHLGRLLLITVACLAAIYVVLRLLSVLRFPGRVFDVLTNGSSRQVTVMATFLRRLAESLNTGLPLPTALRLAGHSSGKPWLLRKAVALAHGLETDWAENERPPWATGLPPSVVYALRAGAEGGPNVRLLQEIAEIYAERVRNRFDWSTGLLPRLLILVVGFVVAMVVLALFLPLLDLINGLA